MLRGARASEREQFIRSPIELIAWTRSRDDDDASAPNGIVHDAMILATPHYRARVRNAIASEQLPHYIAAGLVLARARTRVRQTIILYYGAGGISRQDRHPRVSMSVCGVCVFLRRARAPRQRHRQQHENSPDSLYLRAEIERVPHTHARTHATHSRML